jgi:hypothetical protein
VATLLLAALLGWRTVEGTLRLVREFRRHRVETLSNALRMPVEKRLERALSPFDRRIAAALERHTPAQATVHTVATQLDLPSHNVWLRLATMLYPRALVPPAHDVSAFAPERPCFVLRIGPPEAPVPVPALAGAAPVETGNGWALYRLASSPP